MRWHPPYFLISALQTPTPPTGTDREVQGTGLPGEWDLLRPALLLLLGNWGEENGWENWLGWAISATPNG